MNIKRIVLFAAVLMIIISSLSIVSADVLDFLGGGDNNVNGIDFNIPEGFTRQNVENGNDSVKANFTNQHTIFTIIVHNSDSKITPEGFNNDISNKFDAYQKKSISGHEGFMVNAKKRVYFTYLENDKVVEINAPNEKFISQLIK